MSDRLLTEVRMWGRTIGAAAMHASGDYARFQYDPSFAKSGIEIAPLMMPLSDSVYEFPALSRQTFAGLNGLLADSLPDRFGNALIDAWLASEGRSAESFGALDRLCYIGTRGMGALEFAPARGPRTQHATAIDIDALVQLASDVLAHRTALHTSLAPRERQRALRDILRVGTSAGGARAKAVIAWNPHTNEVRSGQIDAGSGFEYWLLKFDGVAANRDKELNDPKGFGAIEYAYARMAQAAGITMSECRLLEENGRRHFMSRRFDRQADGSRLHMQSLGAIAHFDFNLAGAYSYEQALLVMRQLQLPMDAIEQQYRRMVFNILARNQDDHVKNIAFLMSQDGAWSLAPAFDITYSYNPQGLWTNAHQMSVNGKRDHFTTHDLSEVARIAHMHAPRARRIVQEVTDGVQRWPEFAAQAAVPEVDVVRIQRTHRGAIQ